MKANISLANVVRAAAVGIILAVAIIFAMRSESQSLEPPGVVTAVAPIFPPAAVASNTSGQVVIEVKINAEGGVTSAKIVDGHPLFRQGKIYEETARHWRFAPAKDGMAMRTARLTFSFSIMPKNTSATELTTVFTPPYQVEVRHKPFDPVIDKQANP